LVSKKQRMINRVVLIFTFMVLTGISSTLFAASPLEMKDKNYFKGSSLGYSTPSFAYLRFVDSEYLKINPGYFWMDDIYLTILDTQLLGNDFFAKKAEGEKLYINTLYSSIIKVGGLWMWPKVKLYGDLHIGVLYTNYMKEVGAINSEIETATMLAGGFSTGVRWTPGKWQIEGQFSLGQTDKNQIANSYLEIGYQLSPKWKVGIFVERAQRTINICDDKENDECKYIMVLNYGAVFVSYNIYKKHWILFGIGGSSIDLGYENSLTKESTGGSLYLSFR
jgi:hypothetical protein